MREVEPFDIDGMSPAEVIDSIHATFVVLLAEAFAHGYQKGHKDGMEEAVTTITE